MTIKLIRKSWKVMILDWNYEFFWFYQDKILIVYRVLLILRKSKSKEKSLPDRRYTFHEELRIFCQYLHCHFPWLFICWFAFTWASWWKCLIVIIAQSCRTRHCFRANVCLLCLNDIQNALNVNQSMPKSLTSFEYALSSLFFFLADQSIELA